RACRWKAIARALGRSGTNGDLRTLFWSGVKPPDGWPPPKSRIVLSFGHREESLNRTTFRAWSAKDPKWTRRSGYCEGVDPSARSHAPDRRFDALVLSCGLRSRARDDHVSVPLGRGPGRGGAGLDRGV